VNDKKFVGIAFQLKTISSEHIFRVSPLFLIRAIFLALEHKKAAFKQFS
jgi:hypothetical protein